MPPADTPQRAPARVRLGLGAAVVVVLAALAVTVGIGVVRARGSGAEESVTIAPADAGHTSAAAGKLYVHVSGAVRAPGLYVLPQGSRVVDAVAAAGGFSHDAARDGVNLARAVADGEQLAVPRKGEAVPDAGAAAGGKTGGKVDLNTADEAALDTLPRIGPATAKRIIAWREQNGPFTSVEDLLAVPGIGEKMLETLRDLVTV